MPLTPEDVQSKRFSTVRFKEGYDEEEVDGFLDEVEAELRRLLSENTELRASPGAAPAAAAPAPAATPSEEPSEAALRTLLLAQRTADEAIAQAKQEADQIVAAAKVRATSIESEAQAQHAQAMADLSRQRTSLETQIEQLRGFEREYRTRLKAYLEGQLRELEARTGVAPGGPGATTVGAANPPAAAAPAAPAGRGPAAGGGPAGGPSGPVGGAHAGGPVPVPGLAPSAPVAPPAHAAPAQPPRPAPASPFSAAPPLVEDVDSGSDAPTGPPREPEADTDTEQAPPVG